MLKQHLCIKKLIFFTLLVLTTGNVYAYSLSEITKPTNQGLFGVIDTRLAVFPRVISDSSSIYTKQPAIGLNLFKNEYIELNAHVISHALKPKTNDWLQIKRFDGEFSIPYSGEDISGEPSGKRFETGLILRVLKKIFITSDESTEDIWHTDSYFGVPFFEFAKSGLEPYSHSNSVDPYTHLTAVFYLQDVQFVTGGKILFLPRETRNSPKDDKWIFHAEAQYRF